MEFFTILLRSKLDVQEAQHTRDMCEENWEEAHTNRNGKLDTITPDVFPYLEKNVLWIPHNHDVIEDFMIRIDDGIDIAIDNIYYLTSQNPNTTYQPVKDEIKEYQNMKKSYERMKEKINKKICEEGCELCKKALP
jgi:hypothetical protein